MSWRNVAVLTAVIVALGAIASQAGPSRTLPAFEVSSPDGRPVSSDDLIGRAPQIVLYVAPGCRPCDRLLPMLVRRGHASDLTGLVVIVGAPHETARSYVHRALTRKAGRLRWYVDGRAEAWDALELVGAPALVGIREGRIEWEMSGGLDDPDRLDRLIHSWLTD